MDSSVFTNCGLISTRTRSQHVALKADQNSARNEKNRKGIEVESQLAGEILYPREIFIISALGPDVREGQGG